MPTHLLSKARKTWIVAIGIALAATRVQAASFPCEKANAPVEKAICGSPEISILDEYLGRYYAAAREHLRHADACMVADQRRWIRTVRDACKDPGCLKGAYLNRLAALHSLQPGATSLRTVEWPPTASLLWVIPPAGDQVAAPRDVRTRPLVVRGRIVNDVENGDGYVVQSDDGAKHVIALLMFLDEQTRQALDPLAQATDSRFEVHGRTETTAASVKSFAPSQCTFIYRLPR